MDTNEYRHSPYYFPIKRPVLATLSIVTVVVFGLLSLRLLPINMMPEITYPSITVRTEYPGAAPEEVEQVVTNHLEQSLSVLRDLVDINSSSRAGYSDIQLEFAWNTDMNRATQEVREKLDLVFLPEEVQTPLILRYDPSLDPLIRIGLTSDSLEPRELRDIAERIVKTELEKLGGVAAVKVRGGEETEIRVEVIPGSLDLLNLSLEKIQSRIAAENVNVAGGRLKDGGVEYIVRTLSEFKSVEEIAEISIDVRSGEIIRLKDVAKVSLASKEVTTMTRSRGLPSVELELFRESDANPVSVSDIVKKRITGEMKGKKLRGGKGGGTFPGGFRRGPTPISETLTTRIPIEVLSDQAEFLRQAIKEVRSAAVLGGLLASLILFLFLGNLLDTLIVAMVIPVSLVSAFAAMNYWHITLNVMSLGGLALGIGMMVDNSIVVVESIFRRREQGDDVEKAAVNGTKIVGGAVFASTLTTVVVFFPVVFVTGVAGQIFGDLSMSVIIALTASLAIALFYVPLLVVRFHRKEPQTAHPKETTNPRRWFGNSISYFAVSFELYRRKPFKNKLLLSIYLLPYICFRLIVSLFFNCIGSSLYFIIRLIEWLKRKTEKSRNSIFQFPKRTAAHFNSGVRLFTDFYTNTLGRLIRNPLPIIFLALAGAAIAWFFVTPRLGSELIPEVSQGVFDAKLTLPVGSSLDRTDTVVRNIEQQIKNHPEVIGVSSRIGSDPTDANTLDEGTHTGRITVQLRSGDNLQSRETAVIEEIRRLVAATPSLKMIVSHPTLFTFKQPVEVILKSDDLNQLSNASASVQEALSSISNLSDIESSVKSGHPEIIIQFNREKLARLNISQQTIAERLKASVLGEVASKFRQTDRHIDIRVNLREADRRSIEDIANLVINPDDEVPIRLSEVAALKIMEGPADIRHADGVRAAILTAGLKSIDLGRVVKSLDETIPTLNLPPDVSIELGGQYREMDESLTSLYWALLLAVFLVYVVMASQFESFGIPFLILFTIPFSVIAVIPILWLTNVPISIMVFLGLIILVGVVVNNSIVLVDYTGQLRRQGLSVEKSLLEASRSRLRPILMTTLTTILGLLPIALGMGEGAEMRRPMAVTVMAGLSIGTLVTLVLIPLIYRLTTRDVASK